jgi:CheY-like chemotaxis protein
LTELHGGGVVAISEGENKGALFEVELDVTPNESESTAERDSSVNAGPPNDDNSPLRNMNVLIVEDSADASEMLHVVLEDAGARVQMAVDYHSALQSAAESWPDVLISDIGLPGRDGYELIRELRRAADELGGRRLLAVALTAFAREQDRGRALAAGFDAHLEKPLQPYRLISAIVELAGTAPNDAGGNLGRDNHHGRRPR